MAQNFTLNIIFSKKTKEDVGGSDLGFQTEERQFTWRWKSKRLMNKCLLGSAETMEHRVGWDLCDCSFPHHAQPSFFADSLVTALLQRLALYLNFLRKDRLPESSVSYK